MNWSVGAHVIISKRTHTAKELSIDWIEMLHQTPDSSICNLLSLLAKSIIAWKNTQRLFVKIGMLDMMDFWQLVFFYNEEQ